MVTRARVCMCNVTIEVILNVKKYKKMIEIC